MKKRVLAILLCVCMVTSLFPIMSLPAAAKQESITEESLNRLGFSTATNGLEDQIKNAKLPHGGYDFSLYTLNELLVTRGPTGRTYDGDLDTNIWPMHSQQGGSPQPSHVGSPADATLVRSEALDLRRSGKAEYVAQYYAVVNTTASTTALYLRIVDARLERQGSASNSKHIFTLPFVVTATQASAYLSIATGDYNGDGADEIAVYKPGIDFGGGKWGAAVCFYGATDSTTYKADGSIDRQGKITLTDSLRNQYLNHDVPANGGGDIRDYLCVDLATVRHAGEDCDDLSVTTSFSRYSTAAPKNPSACVSRVYMWSDPLKDCKISTAPLIWNWMDTYGVTDATYANYREQMMFAGVGAGDLNHDGMEEVVVGGYRRDYADTTSTWWSVSPDEVMVTYYKYNPATRYYEPGMKGAQWLSIAYEDYKKSLDLHGGIYNKALIEVDYVLSPLEVTCFAERGDAFGESALVGGLVVALSNTTTEFGTGQGVDGISVPYDSKYTTPDYMPASALAQFVNNGFRVRYALPLYGGCEVGSGSGDTANSAVTAAVAGNFSSESKANTNGKEQLAVMYNTRIWGTTRYYTYVCTVDYTGSGDAIVRNTTATAIDNVNFQYSTEIASDYTAPVSISAPDIDDDSVLMRLDRDAETEWYFSDPCIIAVLQAAPYFGEIVTTGYTEDTGATAVSNSAGSSGGSGHEFTVSAGTVSGFEQGASFVIDLANAKLEIQSNFSAGYAYEEESSISYSLGFEAVSTDTVALSMTPYVRYNYEIWDKLSGTWRKQTVDQPNIPQITQVTVDKYDGIAAEAGWTTIRDNVLNNSQPGNPNTYFKTAPNDTWSAGKTSGASLDTGGFVHLGSGEGGITLGIDAEKSKSHSINWGAGVDTTAEMGFFGAKCGFHVGLEYNGGYTFGSTTGTSYSGTVADISDELSSDYGFDWSFGSWTKDLSYTTSDGEKKTQNCIVLGYQVRNIQCLPQAPLDLNISDITTDSLGLSWSPTAGAEYYAVYRYLPDSKIYYQLATVPFDADATIYKYKDEGLDPATTYIYSVRAYGSKSGLLRGGLHSPNVAGRTNPVDRNAPKIKEQPQSIEAPATSTATFAVGVQGATGGAAPIYRWQIYAPGGWTDIKSATDKTLTIPNVTEQQHDGNRYRCLVIQKVGGTVYTLYSNAATLTIGKANTTTEVALFDKTGKISVNDGATALNVKTPKPGLAPARMTVKFDEDSYTVLNGTRNSGSDAQMEHVFLQKGDAYFTMAAADVTAVKDAYNAANAVKDDTIAYPGLTLGTAPVKIDITPATITETDPAIPVADLNRSGWKEPEKAGDYGFDNTLRDFGTHTNIPCISPDDGSIGGAAPPAFYQVWVEQVKTGETTTPGRILYRFTNNNHTVDEQFHTYYLKGGTPDAVSFTELVLNESTCRQNGKDVPNFDMTGLSPASVKMDGTVNVVTPCDPLTLRATVKALNVENVAVTGAVTFTIVNKDTGVISTPVAPVKTATTAGEKLTTAEVVWQPTAAGHYEITAAYRGSNACNPAEPSAAQKYRVYEVGTTRLSLVADIEETVVGVPVTLTPVLYKTAADGTETEEAVTNNDTTITYTCTGNDVLNNLESFLGSGLQEENVPLKQTDEKYVFTPTYGFPYVLTATYSGDGLESYTATKTIGVKNRAITVTVPDQEYATNEIPTDSQILSTDKMKITDTLTKKEIMPLGSPERARFIGDNTRPAYIDVRVNGGSKTVPREVGSYSLTMGLDFNRDKPWFHSLLNEYGYRYDITPVEGTLKLTTDQYPVTFVSDSNGSVQAAVTAKGADAMLIGNRQAVAKGSNVTFAASPAVGYTVDMWTVNGAPVRQDDDPTKPPVASLTLSREITEATNAEVHFRADNYKLTYGVDGAGGTLKANYPTATGSEITSGATIASMQSVRFTAVPADDTHAVSGWTVDNVPVKNEDGTPYMGDSYLLENATTDTEVKVSFGNAESYTVKASGMDQYGNDKGSVTVSPSLPESGKVETNANLTFTAVPPDGYILTEWRSYDADGKYIVVSKSKDGLTYRVASVQRDLDIRAVFAAPARSYVKWTKAPHSTAIEAKTGSTVLNNNTGNNISYENGIPLTFTATPEDGYKVTEWFVNNVSQGRVAVGETQDAFTVPALDKNIAVTYTCGLKPVWNQNVGNLAPGSQGTAGTWDLTGKATAASDAVYTLASGNALPVGLTLSEAGRITGTPTDSGYFTFTVCVTDSVDRAEHPFSLYVCSNDVTVQSVTVKGRATEIDETDATKFTCTWPKDTDLSAITAEDFEIIATHSLATKSIPATTDGGTTWTFTVTAENGTTFETYTGTMTVSNEFVPVTDITGVPTKTLVNLPLTLTGTTAPADATKQTIVWTIDENNTLTDATITNGVLTTPTAGTVTVKATITAGKSEAGSDPAEDYTRTFDIVVSEPTIAPVTKTIGLGEKVTFTVTADSSAPLTYQWQKSTDDGNWSNIHLATTSSYTTSEATAAGTTVYRCVVSTGGSNVNLDATLTVKAATRFTLTVVDGSISGSRSTTGEYLPDDVVTLVAAAAPDGKVFSKWTATLNENTFTTPLETTTDYTMPNAAVTVTATYVDKPSGGGGGGGGGGGQTEKSYTLSFSTGDGTALKPLNVKADRAFDLSAYSTTLKNFTFDGWYADAALTKPISSITLTKDTTIYAKWTPVREPSFTDVTADDWFQKAVEYVYLHDIMQGTTGSEFSPYLTTTRGMIVTVLWRMEGQPATTAVDAFPDLTADWYKAAVNWASEFGIVLGYENGNFGPLDNITREQMAAVFYRYAKYKGYDVTATADLSQFLDVATVSNYAIPALQWAVGINLLQGSNNNLMPHDGANRAQLATVLYRFCEKLDK